MKAPIKKVCANILGFDFIGDGNYNANNIAGLSEADKTCITFFRGNDLEKLSQIEVAVLLVEENLQNKVSEFKSKSIVFCDNPKYHWIRIIAENYENSFEKESGYVTNDDSIKISNQAFIEKNVIIESHSQIYPNVCIYKDTIIGKACEIQSGSVVGGIGLGDVLYNGKFHKFVHLGSVIIEDNVSIGTNVSILKGMLEKTIIGEGTKIGNNVNIGHNVRIGKNCYISSGTTIGGASIIEDNCWISVGVTLNDHVHMKKNSKAGTGSVVIKDTIENGFYLGNPARKISERVD